jgi:hypothetical protein
MRRYADDHGALPAANGERPKFVGAWPLDGTILQVAPGLPKTIIFGAVGETARRD